MKPESKLSAQAMRLGFEALPGPGKVWVGFSGGLDSTVLLHLLHGAGLRPTAVHVNHHLQPAAAAWEQHCRDVCVGWGVPVLAMDVRIAADDPAGPEAAARDARYRALRGCLRDGDVLATAHHLDDQAETVLLRMVRGTGVTGLAAIRPIMRFPPGLLWRPLLDVGRDDLRAYARQHALRWIEDPHNEDPRYSRSWLRTEIMGRLRARWPAVNENLARLARLAGESAELARELGAIDLAALRSGKGLSIRGLLALPAPRRHNAVRVWLTELGLEAPGAEMLDRMDSEVLEAADDAQPLLGWADQELRRYRDRLYVMPRLPAPPAGVVRWDAGESLALPAGCGSLSAGRAPPAPLLIRFPQGGERIKPRARAKTRTLKNLCQEAGIPPWVRERMPLIYLQDRLVAVADRWTTAEFAALATRQRFRPRWEHALAGDF